MQNSLKRLAELNDALDQLRHSDLPVRVKRARERQLMMEMFDIIDAEPKTPVPPGMCTRCREVVPVVGSTLCHTCILYYLDSVPRWVRDKHVTGTEGSMMMAGLFNLLLRNNLVGTDEPTPHT